MEPLGHRKGSCGMSKNLEISVLLDFYGEMLTEKQREVVELYYNEDLSLGEIAQFSHITRQGVRDSIKRAEAVLLQFEERLGLAKKFQQYQEELERVIHCAREISFEAERFPHVGRVIQNNAQEIIQIANRLCE